MPKLIGSDVKQVVLNVKKFCLLEKQKLTPIIPFTKVRQRVACATGFSLRSIARIVQEKASTMGPTSKIVTRERKNKSIKDSFSESEGSDDKLSGMDVCRACLSSQKTMKMDNTLIATYNLITNLNIAPTDGLPLKICPECCAAIKEYNIFRDNCIASENQLRLLLEKNVKVHKPTEPNQSSLIKVEIKEETVSDAEDLDFNTIDEVYHSDENDVKVSDNEQSIKLDIDEMDDILLVVKKKSNHKSNKPKGKRKKQSKEEKIGTSSCTIVKRDPKKNALKNKKNKVVEYPCGLCTQSFDNKQDISKHIETHRTGSLSCKNCEQTFTSWPSLVGHRTTHNDPSQTVCHLCDVSKRKATYMEAHYINMHCDPSENFQLMCIPCNKSFLSARRLEKHNWHLHSNKNLPCTECGKIFNTQCSLTAHKLVHRKDKKYKCSKCDYNTNYAYGLSMHVLRMHSEEVWRCTPCGRPFESEARRLNHICPKTNEEAKRVCTICGKVLFKFDMGRHMRIHKNIKYTCDLCSKAFCSKKTLKFHINRHNGVRDYKCEYCPMKFYTPSSRIKHRRTHTGEKPYVCTKCGKGFTGNYNLKVHMKIHGEDLIQKRGLKYPE